MMLYFVKNQYLRGTNYFRENLFLRRVELSFFKTLTRSYFGDCPSVIHRFWTISVKTRGDFGQNPCIAKSVKILLFIYAKHKL